MKSLQSWTPSTEQSRPYKQRADAQRPYPATSTDVYLLIPTSFKEKANTIEGSPRVHKHKTQKSWRMLNFRQCAHFLFEKKMPEFLKQIIGKKCRTSKNPRLSLIKWNNVPASDFKVRLHSILIFFLSGGVLNFVSSYWGLAPLQCVPAHHGLALRASVSVSAVSVQDGPRTQAPYARVQGASPTAPSRGWHIFPHSVLAYHQCLEKAVMPLLLLEVPYHKKLKNRSLTP